MRLHARSKRSFWKIVGAAILSAAALAGAGPGAGAAQSVPANDRAHGMVWDGLAPGRAENRCQGIFEIRGRSDQVLGCTHGPDPAPKNVDVRTPVATDTIFQMTATLPSAAV